VRNSYKNYIDNGHNTTLQRMQCLQKSTQIPKQRIADYCRLQICLEFSPSFLNHAWRFPTSFPLKKQNTANTYVRLYGLTEAKAEAKARNRVLVSSDFRTRWRGYSHSGLVYLAFSPPSCWKQACVLYVLLLFLTYLFLAIPRNPSGPMFAKFSGLVHNYDCR